MANGKYFLCFSILFMLSFNKSYKNRKVSLTIHCKYKYFDSTVQRAEDRRKKFYFCRLPFAVNVKLNLSTVSFNHRAASQSPFFERLGKSRSADLFLTDTHEIKKKI